MEIVVLQAVTQRVGKGHQLMGGWATRYLLVLQTGSVDLGDSTLDYMAISGSALVGLRKINFF
jgi:hypothetical protein